MEANSEKEPLRVITQQESWLQEVDQSIVEMLEEALKRAKEGEFDGMAIVASCKDGCSYATYSKLEKNGIIIAAVERLKFSILGSW